MLDYFKKRDLLYEMNVDDNALPLNLETTAHHQSNEEEEEKQQTHAASTSTSSATNSRTATNQRVYKTYSQR